MGKWVSPESEQAAEVLGRSEAAPAARAKTGSRLALAAALWIVVLAVGSSAQQQRTADARQSSLGLAQSLLAAGNSAQAINVMSAHLQKYPNDASARLLLAEAYEDAGQTDRAEAQYQSILRFAPDNYLALAGLGDLYDRTGNPEKSEPFFAHAAKASHGSPRIQTAWAAVLARLHRYNDASRALAGLAAPSSSEERLSFYRVKASVAAGLGNAAVAASDMEQALALAPNQSALQAATAAAEVQAKHWQRAARLIYPLFARNHDSALGLMLIEAELGAGEEIHPTLQALRSVSLPQQEEALFRQRLSELLIEHERFKEAAGELKREVELEPTRADLNFNLALAQYKADEPDNALTTAESLQKTGDSAELEDLIGDIQEALGDNLAAVHSYEAAVALAPNEEKYRLSLAVELIRHKSFAPARAVLLQAEGLYPNSWQVQLALGMVEYFAGSSEKASQTLLKAADLAPDAQPALTYLGDIQMDASGSPDAAALTRICEYGDTHPKSGTLELDCAALLFRKAYASNDRSRGEDIVRRLNATAKALPGEPSPHCQLGKAYRWLERWQDALRESEICVRMDPTSADAHYRLAQLYQHLGQKQQFAHEMKSYETASAHIADENARRDRTIKTFVYSIQNDSQQRK